MEGYSVTRGEILAAAGSMRGLRFLHQGRDPETGVDCVGLLVVMGRMIGYPWLQDAEGYRRTPSADTIRRTLEANCDEIPLGEARPGDIFLMRMGGIKPRHCSLLWSEGEGVRAEIIHASRDGVRVQPKCDYPKEWYVAAFRVRGVAD